jgi:replicative DNA helicase
VTAAPWHAEQPRQLPTNYDAEQAVLAAILANNEALDLVDGLEPEHFAEPCHGRIFAACRALVSGGQVANAVTLKNAFENDEALKDVGGAKYLAELQGNFISIVGAPDYASTVTDCHVRRELIAAQEDAIERLHGDFGTDGRKHAEALEHALTAVLEAGERGSLEPLSSIAQATLTRLKGAWSAGEDLVGLTTGFAPLDRLTSGLEAPDLIILAGRPGMGKTALALSMADRQAHEGLKVGFFSKEMSAEALVTRHLAAESGVPFPRLRSGRCGWGEQQRAEEAAAKIAKLPIHIDDTAGLSVTQMHTRARRLKRRGLLDVIYIDHLGYVAPPDPKASEVKQPGDKLKALKLMGKDLDCPVVVLQQLSRANLQRDDKRPNLGDLRGSGQIEEDADQVWFLHRESYYVERAEPKRKSGEKDPAVQERVRDWQMSLDDCRKEAEVTVAKQRNGPIETVKLGFEGRVMRFD